MTPPFQQTNTDARATVSSGSSPQRATMGCVVRAHGAGERVAEVIGALLSQTRVPDVIHVVADSAAAGVAEWASAFAGPHELCGGSDVQYTEVFVHAVGIRSDSKVDALNYGFGLVEGYDHLLVVDGAAVPDARAVEQLEDEILADPRTGAVAAALTIEGTSDSRWGSFLLRGQRHQSAHSHLRSLLRGGRLTVLDRRFALFSTQALREVMEEERRTRPWTSGPGADPRVSLQLRRAGYATRISPAARVDVPGLTSLRALHAREVTRQYGMLEELHPIREESPRVRPRSGLAWVRVEQAEMLAKIFVRAAFLVLAVASLSVGALALSPLSPLWLVPIAIAVLLNVRVALSMRHGTRGDVMFALLAVPAEIYTWIRLSQFARARALFFGRRSEGVSSPYGPLEGGGRSADWTFVIAGTGIAVVAVVLWSMLGTSAEGVILVVGWWVLAAVVAAQSVLGLLLLARPLRGRVL